MIELKGDEKEPCIYHGFFTVYCWACAFGDDFVDTLFMDGGIAFWEKKRDVCWRSPDTDLMETCIGTGTAMRMWKTLLTPTLISLFIQAPEVGKESIKKILM